MIKILLVSDYYPPYIGGAQRQTQLLARELTKRGHSVQVATLWREGLARTEADGAVCVHRARQLREVLSPKPAHLHKIGPQAVPFPEPLITRDLRTIINTFQPDIVHSFGWITYSCAVALLGTRIPLFISARDYCYSCATRIMLHQGHICEGPGLTKCMRCAPGEFGVVKGVFIAASVRALRPFLKSRVTTVHSISSFVGHVMNRDFLGQCGQRDDANANKYVHTAIIPSFRADDEARLDADETGLEKYLTQLPNEPYILFAGGLRLIKGIQELLQAYANLQRRPTLVLIGYAASDEPSHYPDGVVVLRDFPHKAVMAAWRRSLFGVAPSKWAEPLGSVVHEGMSQGKAVIGTKPSGHTDMIEDGVTGILVPTGDAEALQAAMQTLIDDVELRERMGRTAAIRAELFTAKNSVPKFEQAYLETVSLSAHRTTIH